MYAPYSNITHPRKPEDVNVIQLHNPDLGTFKPTAEQLLSRNKRWANLEERDILYPNTVTKINLGGWTTKIINYRKKKRDWKKH